jgi:hypothetical protein
MPGDDSLRLDKEQCRNRESQTHRTRSAQRRRSLRPRLERCKSRLMPECKNLCLQNSASSETISQGEEYGQHGLGRLPVATL